MSVSQGAFEDGAQFDRFVPWLIASLQEGELVCPQALEQGSYAEGRPLIHLRESLEYRTAKEMKR